MKKLLVYILIALTLTGCSQSESNKALITQQEKQLADLKSEIKDLEQQKSELASTVLKEKEDKGVARYIVTINIKQSHAFWQVKDNIKDSMNDINIELPVDKEFYDSIDVGTVINDEFRVGSLILKGSIGKWDITISDKETR